VARVGLAAAFDSNPDTALAEYRQWPFTHGEQREGTDTEGILPRRGIQREAVLQVLAAKGRLSTPEMLRLRVRYLNDGAILGSGSSSTACSNARGIASGPVRGLHEVSLRLQSVSTFSQSSIGEVSVRNSPAMT